MGKGIIHPTIRTKSHNHTRDKRLLVWDAYKCHTSEAVKAEMSRLCMHTAIVPGGCTKYIQAANVIWNACF